MMESKRLVGRGWVILFLSLGYIGYIVGYGVIMMDEVMFY